MRVLTMEVPMSSLCREPFFWAICLLPETLPDIRPF
jgi:hypothetical protein